MKTTNILISPDQQTLNLDKYKKLTFDQMKTAFPIWDYSLIFHDIHNDACHDEDHNLGL